MRFQHRAQCYFVAPWRPAGQPRVAVPTFERTSAAESRIPFGCPTARVELVPFPICRREPAKLRVGLERGTVWGSCRNCVRSLRSRADECVRPYVIFATMQRAVRNCVGGGTAPLKPKDGLNGPPIPSTRRHKKSKVCQPLCWGKRGRAFAHHAYVAGIGEEPVAAVSRDFFDDAQAYEMVHRTGNGWN